MGALVIQRSLGAARRLSVTGAALVVVAGSFVADPPPAAAQTVCGPLVPQLRDVTVTQGLGQPTAGANGVVAPPLPRLARGKEALAKFFLSLPANAPTGASISRTGGSLTVTAGTTVTTVNSTTPAPVSVFPTLAPYSSAPALASPGDATFVVPGGALAPASTTAAFDARFSATINYTYRCSPTDAIGVPGTATFSFRPGTNNTKPIEAKVDRRSNALRVLLVPMGDPTRTLASQFSDAARLATIEGMGVVSRLFPVPAGISGLSGTAGLRRDINPALLDIRSAMTNGRFCGSKTSFDMIKGPLAQTLLAWNTANPTKPADRVLGVVDAAISDAGCDQGRGVLGGQVGWVRAIPGTTTVPSMTGALMAMELGHLLGIVPDSRDAIAGGNHSPNQQSDVTAPNRAFNLASRSYLLDDRTAMYLSGVWNNRTVGLERDDFLFLLCMLGGSSGGGCTTPGQPVGSSIGVPAAPTLVISGTTDGTAPGTSVVESYIELGVPLTEPDPPGGQYALVQRGPGGEIRRDPVAVHLTESHHAGEEDNGTDTPPNGLFSVAVPSDADATRIELVRGSTLLYARDRTAVPVAGTTTVTPPGPTTPGTIERLTGPGNNSDDPVISSDGRYVAFHSFATNLAPGDTTVDGDIFLRDRTTGTTEQLSLTAAGGQGDTTKQAVNPSISADGRYIAFVTDNALVADDTNGVSDVYVRDAVADTTERVSLSEGDAQVPAGVPSLTRPAISGDGASVAFTSGSAAYVTGDTNGADDVFVRNRVAGTTVMASRTAAGGQVSNTWANVAINGDGRYVVFSAGGSSAADTFVRDLTGGTTEQVSVDSAEADGNGTSRFNVDISADGRYVAFVSTATNLGGSDANGVGLDSFLRDRQAGTSERVSVDDAGVSFTNESNGPTVSDDGRFVLFALFDGSSYDALLRDRTVQGTVTMGVNTTFTLQLAGGGDFLTFRSATSQAGPPVTGQQIYVRAIVPGSAGETVTTSATDDNAAQTRADVFLDCGGDNWPVAVGLTPDEIVASGISFAYTFDPEVGCTGGAVTTVVNDGFSTTEGDTIPVAEDPGNHDPVPGVIAPTPDTTIRAYDGISLRGSAQDQEDGGLGDAALTWRLDGGGVIGTGAVVDLDPPSGGWAPGSHTATLTATDSGGGSASTSVSFTIQGDADNDGVPTGLEGGGCAGGSDTNPTDGYADPDGDGIGNADDVTTSEGPCVAESDYTANLDVKPDLMPRNATSPPVTATITIPFRDVAVVRPESVRIIEISDTPVSIPALSWSVSGGVATATFDRAAVSAVLTTAPGNSSAVFTIAGDALDGSWSFEGNDTVSTK